MQNPSEAMKHLSDQMGWLSQMFGEEFWAKIHDGVRQGQPVTGAPPVAQPRGPLAVPPVEVYTTAMEVVLCALVPGLSGPEQVSLSMAGPAEVVLEAFLPPAGGQGIVLQRERLAGYCARTIALPAAVLPDGAKARYAGGVLEVRFVRTVPEARQGEVALLHVPK